VRAYFFAAICFLSDLSGLVVTNCFLQDNSFLSSSRPHLFNFRDNSVNLPCHFFLMVLFLSKEPGGSRQGALNRHKALVSNQASKEAP
jgi:hypothetical protein